MVKIIEYYHSFLLLLYKCTIIIIVVIIKFGGDKTRGVPCLPTCTPLGNKNGYRS